MYYSTSRRGGLNSRGRVSIIDDLLLRRPPPTNFEPPANANASNINYPEQPPPVRMLETDDADIEQQTFDPRVVTPLNTTVSIIDCCDNPRIFRPWFKDRKTWEAWFSFLRVLFGLKLSDADLATFQKCTGRNDIPVGGFSEAWLVCGRRAGKSLTLALTAVYLACFVSWKQHLFPGERGTIMVVAADRKQSRVIFRYVLAFLKETPLLANLIERETADSVDLQNGVTIEISTANFRLVRGYTLIAALADEIAWWRSDDSANPTAKS